MTRDVDEPLPAGEARPAAIRARWPRSSMFSEACRRGRAGHGRRRGGGGGVPVAALSGAGHRPRSAQVRGDVSAERRRSPARSGCRLIAPHRTSRSVAAAPGAVFRAGWRRPRCGGVFTADSRQMEEGAEHRMTIRDRWPAPAPLAPGRATRRQTHTASTASPLVSTCSSAASAPPRLRRYTKAECLLAFERSDWFARLDSRSHMIARTVLQRDNGIEARRSRSTRSTRSSPSIPTPSTGASSPRAGARGRGRGEGAGRGRAFGAGDRRGRRQHVHRLSLSRASRATSSSGSACAPTCRPTTWSARAAPPRCRICSSAVR